MTRFILIDQNSGFVWGEADATTPIEACRTVDGQIAAPAAHYVEHGPRSAATYDQTGGYYVYEAPADFAEVTDGQDPDQIQAVTALRCVAFVETQGDRYAEMLD